MVPERGKTPASVPDTPEIQAMRILAYKDSP
jgi:hypothetical protein